MKNSYEHSPLLLAGHPVTVYRTRSGFFLKFTIFLRLLGF
jgi:hypothetical protein